jgi:hypothetical protein
MKPHDKWPGVSIIVNEPRRAQDGPQQTLTKYQLIRFCGGELHPFFSENFLAIYRTRSDCRAFIASNTDKRHNSHYDKDIAWLSICVIPDITDIGPEYETHPCFGGYQRWNEQYDAAWCSLAYIAGIFKTEEEARSFGIRLPNQPW